MLGAVGGHGRRPGGFSRAAVRQVSDSTVRTTAVVIAILIGSTAFSLVFRGGGGDVLISELLLQFPGGRTGFLAVSMLVIFALGLFIRLNTQSWKRWCNSPPPDRQRLHADPLLRRHGYGGNSCGGTAVLTPSQRFCRHP